MRGPDDAKVAILFISSEKKRILLPVLLIFVNNKHFYTLQLCCITYNPYLCTVFFMVLDFKVNKDWESVKIPSFFARTFGCGGRLSENPFRVDVSGRKGETIR